MLWSFYLPNTSLQGNTECLALFEGESTPRMVRIEDDKVDTKNSTLIRDTLSPIGIETRIGSKCRLLQFTVFVPRHSMSRTARRTSRCVYSMCSTIQSWHRCISLKYDFYKGTRRMKLLDSNEIRQLRDVCIFEVNGIEVYM